MDRTTTLNASSLPRLFPTLVLRSFVALCLLSLLANPTSAAVADLETDGEARRWATYDGGYWDGQRYLGGDFDGDGDEDIARVYGADGQTIVDTLLSTGESFASARWADPHTVGGFWDSQHYLAADFDGNGRDDIARIFDEGGATTIDVLLSTGVNFMYSRWTTGQGGHWAGLKFVAGDFDGDGFDDVAKVWNHGGLTSIDVYRSNGGAFLPFEGWTAQDGGFTDDQQYVAGDYDGDGLDDIARIFVDAGLVSLDVHRSNGTSFAATRWATRAAHWGSAPRFFGGDFDGDGFGDIALTELGDGGLRGEVLLGVAGQFLHHELLDTTAWIHRVVCGDFDGDGKSEIAGIDGRYGVTSVDLYDEALPWEADGRAVRWAGEQGGFWGSQLYFDGDFDGDGRPDVARVFDDAGATTFDVHRNTGSGFVWARWATRLGGHWAGMQFVAGDFDGDGIDDILRIFDDGGLTTVDIHLGSPTGFTYQRWLTRQGGHWAGMKFVAGDFDGDGLDDLAKVWNHGGLASIDVYRSSGSAFHTFTAWASQSGGFWDEQQYVVGDYDGDGRDDIARIFAEGVLTSIDVFSSLGTHFSQRRWITQRGFTHPHQSHVASDFDGDGIDDIVKFGPNLGSQVAMYLYLSDGVGLRDIYFIEDDLAFSQTARVMAADFDLDGRAEVATAYRTQASDLTNFDVYGGDFLTPLDPWYLSSPGDTKRYTPQEVADALAAQGFTLVASSHLHPGQCTIVYPNSHHSGDSKDLGVMACVSLDALGETLIDWNPVYGGCDVANSGGLCSAGIINETLSVDIAGAQVDFQVLGPGARSCQRVSREAVCARTTVSLWQASFLITDGNGNGGGVGTFVGVGAGVRAQYQNGVLSGTISLGVGPGVHIKYSVNLDSVATVGTAGFEYAQPGIDEAITQGGEVVDVIGDGLDDAFDAAGDVIDGAGDVLDDAGDVFCGIFGC